jgi:hypothetical protein
MTVATTYHLRLNTLVFGCGQESQTRDDIILAALLAAYKDGGELHHMPILDRIALTFNMLALGDVP